MSEEKKIDGWVAWHPEDGVWTDGVDPYNEYPMMFGSQKEGDEHMQLEYPLTYAEGWKIRPVQLVFLDEPKTD